MTERALFERWCAEAPPERRPLLEVWWVAWTRARGGDPEARAELHERVALDARSAGEAGQLASRSLQAWLRLREIDGHPEAKALQDALLRTAADAHAIGVARRVARIEAEAAVARVPIVEPRPGVVAVILAGPMDGALLDAALDRAFRRAVATGSRRLLIDISRSEAETDLLARTLAGLPDVGLPEELTVGLIGAAGARAAGERRIRGVTLHPGWPEALDHSGPA